MSALRVKIPVFEGPMDLLLHLIEKSKLDIYDIPILSLADQYLEYIETHKSDPSIMENSSSFLVMATTLLEIKTKMLLPKHKEEPEEEDPSENIRLRLLEYKRFKSLAELLKETESPFYGIYYKNSIINLSDIKRSFRQKPAFDITQDTLFEAFQEVMRRKEQKVFAVSKVAQPINKDNYKLEDKIEFLRDILTLYKKVEFKSIFRGDSLKIEIVVTFLALLELVRLNEVSVFQDNPFGKIYLLKGEKNET